MKFDFNQYIEASRLSSMDYWWPLTKDLPVPKPRTEVAINMCPEDWVMFIDDPNVLSMVSDELLAAAFKMGYPLFMRTDQSSGKHEYAGTCKVVNDKRLFPNLYRLIEENLMCDLNVQTLYFREFIELDSVFTAFSDMPIAPERRYFVKDGEVCCHHPYWPEAAIRDPNKKDWKKRLHCINLEERCEIELLTRYAQIIGSEFPGSWSIDFAQARDSTWYFIDMADARVSWHPEDCKFYKELSLEQTEPKPSCNVELVRIDEKTTEESL